MKNNKSRSIIVMISLLFIGVNLKAQCIVDDDWDMASRLGDLLHEGELKRIYQKGHSLVK